MNMRPRAPASIVVGVDVGGAKKGFHAVALGTGNGMATMTSSDPASVAAWCLGLGARAVGVDAPCRWSRTGSARSCERELTATGMTVFSTPGRAVGRRHPFYGWMLNGAALFRLLIPHYPLFDGHLPVTGPVCFETFPHAVACALAGRVLSAKRKRIDRPRVLRREGLSSDAFATIDYADAALCALTARQLLKGKCAWFGEAAEGFILVPARSFGRSRRTGTIHRITSLRR